MVPPTEKMLATLSSLSDSIQATWIKLGDKYEEMGERDVHVILHNRHITPVVKERFEDYTFTEAQRAVGCLMKVNAGYQKQWNTKWKTRAAEIEASKEEDERIIAECLTWEGVMEWMTRTHPFYQFVPSYFEFVKKVQKVSYWKRREKTRPLFTRRDVDDKHRQWGLDEAGYTFQTAWQPVNEPGYDGTLWELIPRLQHVCQ